MAEVFLNTGSYVFDRRDRVRMEMKFKPPLFLKTLPSLSPRVYSIWRVL